MKQSDRERGRLCRLLGSVESTELPLVRAGELADGLEILLNGHKTLLVLDTGASGIVVSRSIAKEAGIQKKAVTKMGGIGDQGMKKGFVGFADLIEIGDLKFKDCPVEVLESRSVAGSEGLVGADVFEDFLVDINLHRKKVKLTSLPVRPGENQNLPRLNPEGEDSSFSAVPTRLNDGLQSESFRDRYIAPEMENYTRVFRFGHDLLVPTRIGDVPPKLFLLDTGASTNIISPEAAREVTKVRGDYDTIIEGIIGSVNKVYTAKKAVLHFGGLMQENQRMAAVGHELYQ